MGHFRKGSLGEQLLAECHDNSKLVNMGAVQGKKTVFSTCSYIEDSSGPPEPTKVFLQLSPKMAMPSAPFGMLTRLSLSCSLC